MTKERSVIGQDTPKHSSGLMLVMALAIAFLVSLTFEAGMFASFENLTLDGRFLLNSVTPKSFINYDIAITNLGLPYLRAREKPFLDTSAAEIVFIDMPGSGSGAGAELNRSECATAMKIISVWGARAIIFPDRATGPAERSGDNSLAEAIAGTGKVYLPALYELNKGVTAYLYDGEGVGSGKGPWAFFAERAAGIGHINAWADPDGKVRRVPPVIRYQGKHVYQLGMKAAFDILGLADKDIEMDPEKHALLAKLPLDQEVYIPLDRDNQLIINWSAVERKNIAHVSFRDLVESYRLTLYNLRPIIDPGIFKNKVCILGTVVSNATAGRPQRAGGEAASSAVSGMIANSVLQKCFISEPPNRTNIGLIFLISIIFGVSLVSIRILRIMMTIVTCVTVFSVASLYGMPKVTALVAAVCLSVPLGVFFARFHLFSGLLFTISAAACYLVVSAALFKFFNIAVVTFYPILAAFLVYLAFYAYVQLGKYLSNLNLVSMATKDGLTGLYNRRHFNLLLDAEMSSAVLHKARKLSLLMCDIDNFKKLNDTHGHQAGDTILREFARIVKAKCRQSDIVARYGGEEFIIILHGAGSKDALKVAESVRQAVEERKFTFKDQPYSTSLSMGLVEFRDEKTKEELIEKADQALYRAKKEGKNRVCVNE